MSKSIDQSNILLCGSSRVGKTTLINAICQEKLAKSHGNLSSCTKEIDKYSFETTNGNRIHETIFWDTPGIESWNQSNIQNYIQTLIDQSQPICMIYCASPGSFALIDQLNWIVSECKQKNIFSAFVCTNMWAGKNRQMIINEFCQILNKIYPDVKPIKEDRIIYYSNFALVTMVNSQEYIDEDFGIRKDVEGINELIFGISKSLKRDFMFAWLKTVSQNKSFWTNMSFKISDLLHIPYQTFNKVCQNTGNFLEYLFTFDDDYYQPDSQFSSTDDHKKQDIFYDAELIDIPKDSNENCLRFAVESKETAALLSDVLVKLGAKQMNIVRSEDTDEDTVILTAKFNNVEHSKTIYDFCQIILDNQINCTVVDSFSNC